MKTLYFDCSSGISGNMVLGALTEIIGNQNYLIDELRKLHIDGYNIETSKKDKNGITATYIDVLFKEEHTHRHLSDINKIIDESSLDNNIKDLAKKIFLRVAKAEGKVHGVPEEEVHFHEVGAIDSIIDIVGTAILINKIKPDRIISSIVNDGYGFIECAHGKMSVPVPATSEIFANSNVIFRQIDIDTELVTPTGAAIIAELAKDYIGLPTMNVEKIGWGAGYKKLTIPNVLKVYLGETEDTKEDIVVMETNIDDCSGEILSYSMEQLMGNGALDVFFTPIFMKKNRPSYKLTVCCKNEDVKKLQEIIFKETTTIGIRYSYEQRTELERWEEKIDTKYGKLKVKKVRSLENVFVYPEFESAKELAKENNIPLKELYKLEELNNGH